jgi:hypothetical protein
VTSCKSLEASKSIDHRRALLWGILVAVLTWWTAREVVDFDFVAWDDEYNIVVNPHLGPPSASTIHWMFTDTQYMRRYIPFGWLGFSLAYGASGLSPVAYHTANLALHASNAFLLDVGFARQAIRASKRAPLPAPCYGRCIRSAPRPWAGHRACSTPSPRFLRSRAC